MKHSYELRAAALMAFASLGANDEDIRKKVKEFNKLERELLDDLKSPSHSR